MNKLQKTHSSVSYTAMNCLHTIFNAAAYYFLLKDTFDLIIKMQIA